MSEEVHKTASFSLLVVYVSMILGAGETVEGVVSVEEQTYLNLGTGTSGHCAAIAHAHNFNTLCACAIFRVRGLRSFTESIRCRRVMQGYLIL